VKQAKFSMSRTLRIKVSDAGEARFAPRSAPGQVCGDNLKSGDSMSYFSRRALFWTPRVLSIVFIVFLSLFALDVFEGHLGFWRTALALIMHLIPVFVLTAALILSWRWEWIGAVLYTAAGMLYVVWVLSTSRPVPPAMKMIWILLIAGPAFIIAGLFLANWLKHGQLHDPGR
jgi:hypothetical protein